MTCSSAYKHMGNEKTKASKKNLKTNGPVVFTRQTMCAISKCGNRAYGPDH